MPNSIDDLTEFTLNFFDEWIRLERAADKAQREIPPRDEEEDFDGAFYDDPVYDHFTHRNLGIPE